MRRIVVPVLVPAVVVAVAACRGPSPASPTVPVATPETETGATGRSGGAPEATTPAAAVAAPPGPEEAAILTAVHGYWDAVIAAAAPPNPDHPHIGRFATGPAREALVASVADMRQLGLAVRLPPHSARRHVPEVVEIGTDRAVALDCGVDDAVEYDAASGRARNDAVETRLWRMELRRSDGQWRVHRLDTEAVWEGVSACG